MTKLPISQDLSLPLDVVTKRLAFVGTVGSGKTYAAQKLAELMHEAKAQFIALDPVGVWWGLRLSANGVTPGIRIPVFGGLHGDIPLEPSAGNLMADLIVDRGISSVIDVSQFEYDTDKTRFATDFANRFFFRKKSAPSAVHLFLEECQEFIPQNKEKGEERMLHAFNRIWKIGRNFGIGGSLISQRPQEVNKKALNLSQCLFAFQTMGTHERKAIEEWIQDKALDLDIADDLPKLKVGEPHVWAPTWLGISESVKISKKWTFNASETPEVGKERDVKELAPIDLKNLSEQMKSAIERAKENDPDILKKKVRELEAKLRQQPKATVDHAGINKLVEQAEQKIAESILKQTRKSNQEFLDSLERNDKMIEAGIKKAIEILQGVVKRPTLKLVGQDIHSKFMKSLVPAPDFHPTPQMTKRHEQLDPGITKVIYQSYDRPPGDTPLNRCERFLLAFLYANRERSWSKEQTALMVGYSPRSSVVKNAIGVLVGRGYITRDNGQLRCQVNEVPREVPTGLEFGVDNITRILSKCERELFVVLRLHRKAEFTREDLCAETESHYSPQSSVVKNALGSLRTLGLLSKSHDKYRLSNDANELV